MIKINYLDSVHSTRSSSITINITKAFELIKSNDRIREITEKALSNKDNYKAIKATLPAVQFQFCNAQKNEKITLSGLLFIDIDAKDNTLSLNEIKNTIQDVYKNNLYAGWTTCSGQGLACLLKYKINNTKDYETAWDNVNNTLQQCNITVDKSSRSIKQLCFLPHDSEIYVNSNAYSLDISPLTPLNFESSTNVSFDFNALKTLPKPELLEQKYFQVQTQNEDNTEYLAFLNYLETHEPEPLNYQEWIKHGLALHSIYGESGRDLFKQFSYICNPQEHEDLDKKYNSFITRIQKTSYDINICKALINKHYRFYNFKHNSNEKHNTETYYINKYVSEKKDVLKKAIENNIQIHVESCTGSGKTTAIIKSAIELYENNIIIIVPNRLSAEELSRKLGLGCIVGGITGIDIEVQMSLGIIVMTYDSFVHKINDYSRVKCIIVDEAHTLITDYSANYRKHTINNTLQKIEALKESNADIKIIHVSGTPCRAFLSHYCIKNIKYIQSEQQKYILKDYNYTKLESVIEIVNNTLQKESTKKVLILCNSIRETKVIQETLTKVHRIDNVEVLHSNIKETSNVYHSLRETSKLPSTLRVLCCTSIIESCISIENEDITNVFIIDNKRQYSTTQIRQFTARARKVKQLEVTIFYHLSRTTSNNDKSLDSYLLKSLDLSEYLLSCTNFYQSNTNENKLISKYENSLFQSNKIDVLGSLHFAQKRFHAHATSEQLISELLKDSRFKLFDKLKNDSYYNDLLESSITVEESKIIISEINKKIKAGRRAHATLISCDFNLSISVVGYLSGNTQLAKEILNDNLADESTCKEYINQLSEYSDVLKNDYYFSFIRQMQIANFTNSDIQIIISTCLSSNKLESIMNDMLVSIVYRHIKTQYKDKLKNVYTKSEIMRLENEYTQISKLKLNKSYTLQEITEIVKKETKGKETKKNLTDRKVLSIIKKHFQVQTERTRKNNNDCNLYTLERLFELTDIEEFVKKNNTENKTISLTKYIEKQL